MNLFSKIALFLKMFWIKHRLWKPMIKKTHAPGLAQKKLLMDILKTNQKTVYGKTHNFHAITGYHSFASSVPVQSYEDLRTYIEKQEAEKTAYLNRDRPVLYTRTSGTTGQPKYIPIFEHNISRHREFQQIFSYVQYRDIPGVFSGKILSIVSPAIEGRLETGTPYGSMSGLLYKNLPDFMRSKYVVPYPVYEVADYELKYRLIAAFSISEENLSCMISANPSTFLKIAGVIDENRELLLHSIETGRLESLNRSGENLGCGITKHFRKNTARARVLRKNFSKGQMRFADIWTQLKSVTTWTGGSCGIVIPSLKEQLAPSTHVVELGYLSTEFRGSLTVDAINNIGIPPLGENFFEFVEKDDLESEKPSYLTLEQIERNKQYYIFTTTQNGLYRYFINDIVQVTGFYNKTPTFQFLQKGKGVTNITGEKLYETQVLQAIEIVKREHKLDFRFYVLLADQETRQYRLYLEHKPIRDFDLSETLEGHLSKLNIEYEAKRKSGRLKPLSFHFLKPGTAESYKKHCLAQGQREGQYKLVPLQYLQECSFEFRSYMYPVGKDAD